jgi:phage terminase small subunit
MLTAKQEKFAQLVASGKGQSEAYRGSYNCEKMADTSIYVEAGKLMQNPLIALRIKEIQESIQKKTEITALTLIEELKEIEELAKQPIHGKFGDRDLTNWIKVKQEVAKLLGLYAPTKNETDLKIKEAPKLEIDLND